MNKQHSTRPARPSLLHDKRLRNRLRGAVTHSAAGCWEWRKYANEHGYGRLKVAGRMELAHIVAYRSFRGEIGPGLCVCHRCDNPLCINPLHLFLGTHEENLLDMRTKGRQVKGETHYRAKLNAQKAQAIRDRYASGSASMTELAEQFGVTSGAISAIVHGHTWRTESHDESPGALLVLGR